MLTLEEKGRIILYVAPFAAFFIGVMWQRAKYELEQERGDSNE